VKTPANPSLHNETGDKVKCTQQVEVTTEFKGGTGIGNVSTILCAVIHDHNYKRNDENRRSINKVTVKTECT